MKNTTAGQLLFTSIIVGGGLALAAGQGTPEFLVIAWPVLVLAGVLGSTGLTAWAVEIGIRSARR